jgi:hypothetical protein
LARAGGGTTIDGMRIPQIAGRIRAQDLAAAPAQALRAALTQVGRLLLAGYERAHAGRADVVGMFERRIAKLAAREKLAAQGQRRRQQGRQ